jgi:hypothetical protein
MIPTAWGHDRQPHRALRRWLAFLVGGVLLLLAPLWARAQGTPPDSVTLQWTAPGDDGTIGTATLYHLRMSTSPITGSNWGSANVVAGLPQPLISGTRQSVVVRGLSRDTTYYFAIRAEDDAGNLASISNLVQWDWIFDTSPPAAPTGLAATRPGSNVQLTWNANSEPDLLGYNVYRATVAGGPWTLLNSSPTTGPNYLDTAVPTGAADVWYEVSASDVNLNESARSAALQLTLTVTAPTTAVDALAPGYPNPSRTGDPVCMPLTLSGSGTGARIDILNSGGLRVRILEVSSAPRCPDGSIQWDGRNDAGAEVAPGVYRAWLVDGDRRSSIKLVRQP